MKLAYYITSHGFGHGLRSCVICNCLSPDVDIVLKTLLPQRFFKEEIFRQYQLVPGAFDCGCIQLDSVTVDKRKTMASYKSIADNNARVLDREVKWCVDNNIDGIASDIAPFAFEAAFKAGIPSVAITNFTWFDIYKDYCDSFPEFLPCLEKIKRQYDLADLLLELTPANSMDYFEKRKKILPVGRVGRNIREKILEFFGINPNKRIGLIYNGTFGMDSMNWSRLEQFGEWEFFGLHEIPGSPKNFHLVSKKEFRYQDMIASSDVMLSKIGYGVYAECLLNGTPLIYLPREDFAEYPVLAGAMEKSGTGYCLCREDYYNLNWDEALETVLSKGKSEPVSSCGAADCAAEIENIIRIR